MENILSMSRVEGHFGCACSNDVVHPRHVIHLQQHLHIPGLSGKGDQVLSLRGHLACARIPDEGLTACRRVSGEGIVVPVIREMNVQYYHNGSTTSSSDLTRAEELKPAHIWGVESARYLLYEESPGMPQLSEGQHRHTRDGSMASSFCRIAR